MGSIVEAIKCFPFDSFQSIGSSSDPSLAISSSRMWLMIVVVPEMQSDASRARVVAQLCAVNARQFLEAGTIG